MTRILLLLAAVGGVTTLALFPAMGAAHGGDPDDMMDGLAMSMKHPMMMTGGSAAKLSIVHVQQGCHVWTDGARKAPGAKLTVKRGARVTVSNMDIDAHKLVRVAGPKIPLGPALKMGKQVVLRFAKSGTYRLMTKKVEGAGPEMNVKTDGADYVLGLVVVVR